LVPQFGVDDINLEGYLCILVVWGRGFRVINFTGQYNMNLLIMIENGHLPFLIKNKLYNNKK